MAENGASNTNTHFKPHDKNSLSSPTQCLLETMHTPKYIHLKIRDNADPTESPQRVYLLIKRAQVHKFNPDYIEPKS